MRLFDSHAHFDAWSAAERRAVCARAFEAGVDHIIAIGGCPASNTAALEVASEWPDRIGAAIGLDRGQAREPHDLSEIEALLRRPEVVAVGETGLDYHYDRDTAAQQRELFEAMLELARRLTLPVVVHSREAEQDTLDILREHTRRWQGDPGRIGVLHCFTGSYEMAAELVSLGWFISFSGILTFPSGGSLRAVAARLPADRLLVETDSPYLAPVPWRGSPNEPSRLRAVVLVLARARGVTLEEMAETTWRNGMNLFGGRLRSEGR